MDEDEGEVEAGGATGGASGEAEEEQKPKKEKRTSKTSRTSKSSQSSSKRRSSSFSQNQQQLFLVEFLVDTVCIDPCAVDEEVLEGQTCLSLTFLNFPPMDICEKDFDTAKPTCNNKVRFNCGKSLMFALNETQCDRPPPLAVEITVLKKLGDDENAVKVEIGVIKVCISELFRQIVDVARYKPDKLPASKSIKDCFMLIGPGKRTMGEVSVYIRLSCLGQNVVTEFQCGPDMKTSPVLFKSREGRKLFEFAGTEGDAEGGEAGAAGKGKQGCGCIPPPSGKGQGDGGKDPAVSATYSKGNKVILDVPGKNGKRGGDGAPEKSKQKEKPPPENEEEKSDQNVFVLRVGDKGQIPDRGKMILEFKTPKQKILPKVIPPYHEEVAVQTDSGKKGKGKGKRGKKK